MKDMSSVWSTDWIHLFESPWSLLEKYTLTNIATKNEVLRLLGNQHLTSLKHKIYADKYRNLLTLDGFDHTSLCHILGFDLKEHNDSTISILTSKISCDCRPAMNMFYTQLRWCSECMSNGFHSLFHQSKLLRHCPFHKTDLISNCPECNQQIMYKFSDREMSGPFTCQCGHSLINYSERWKEWGSPLKIECAHTLKWLEDKADAKSIMIFNPRHLVNAENPIKFFVDVNEGNPEDLIIIQASKYISNQVIDDLKCHKLSNAEDPHMRQYGIEGETYYKFNVNLYEVTRRTFLSIDRHLRNTILRKHLNCITRLQYVLKERETTFPPICPFAYAYVFWRQSLLGIDRYYRKKRSVPHVQYLKHFEVIGVPFIDDLRSLLKQFVNHYPPFTPNKPGIIGWILSKAATHYFMQYFRNWIEVAAEGARNITVPIDEELIELSNKNMPLLVFKIPLIMKNNAASLYIEKRHTTENNCIDLVCPFNTVSLRRIKTSEINHSPLSMAIDNHETDDKHIENLKYASDYVKRLSF